MTEHPDNAQSNPHGDEGKQSTAPIPTGEGQGVTDQPGQARTAKPEWLQVLEQERAAAEARAVQALTMLQRERRRDGCWRTSRSRFYSRVPPPACSPWLPIASRMRSRQLGHLPKRMHARPKRQRTPGRRRRGCRSGGERQGKAGTGRGSEGVGTGTLGAGHC